MKVLARHYLCFAGQLCGVSTDGTGFTAIVRRICVHVIGVIPASGTAAACKRASRHDDGSSFVVAFHASLKKQARKLPVNGNRRGSGERACHGCRCKQAAVPARRSTHVDDLSVASRRASSPSHLNPSSLSHSTLLADAGCC